MGSSPALGVSGEALVPGLRQELSASWNPCCFGWGSPQACRVPQGALDLSLQAGYLASLCFSSRFCETEWVNLCKVVRKVLGQA